MNSDKQTFITEEGYRKIVGEYQYLKNVKRKEIASRIEIAKSFGDLSENAEYADAKNEQSFNEGRIMELEALLKTAVVIKQTSGGSTVAMGSKIKIIMDGSKKDFMIVGSQEADPIAGKISYESPMGKSFLGKKVGDRFEIEVPKGKIKIEIVGIE